MANKIKLTYTQCKQITSNSADLREFAEQVNDQPDFMSASTGMQIDSLLELQAINQSGCAAIEHNSIDGCMAAQCMSKHGDEALEYIEELYGELPLVSPAIGWNKLASYYLVKAVEAWCKQFSFILEDVDV